MMICKHAPLYVLLLYSVWYKNKLLDFPAHIHIIDFDIS